MKFLRWPFVGAALAARTCSAAVLLRGGADRHKGIPETSPSYIDDPALFSKSNPYIVEPRFQALEDRDVPTAPEDDVRPGIEAQGAEGGPGEFPEFFPVTGKAAYRPYAHDDPYDAFPQTYDDNSESIRKARLGARPLLACVNSPWNWRDMRGFDCQSYVAHQWCTSHGSESRTWPSWWGKLGAAGGRGLAANEACCACGGGIHTLVSSSSSTPIEDRNIIASADRVAEHLAKGKEPTMTATAAKDLVPIKYAQYFSDLEKQKAEPMPMGLTGRFYGFLPGECSRPQGTAIVRGIDYRIAGDGGSRMRLDTVIPNKRRSVGGYFWAKFTGTLKVFTAGVYTFNLRPGFDTDSTFKVDDQNLLTRGQCFYGRDLENCHAKGCVWLLASESCVPYATEEELKAEEEAAKAAAAFQIVVDGAKEPSGKGDASGAAPAPAPLGAGAPSAPMAPAPSAGAAMAPGPAPSAFVQMKLRSRAQGFAPGPAPSPGASQAPSPGYAAPEMMGGAGFADGAGLVNGSMNGTSGTNGTNGTNGTVGKDFDWGKYTEMLKKRKGVRPNQIVLSAGGHCVDVLVAVTPSGRTLQLTYEGPDTEGKMTVVPGQVFWCDPVVEACTNPALDSCALYRPKCSGMDLPFAGPAAKDYTKMPRATMPDAVGLAPGALSAVLPGALMMPGAQPLVNMSALGGGAQAMASAPGAPVPAPAPMGLTPGQLPSGLQPVAFAGSSPEMQAVAVQAASQAAAMQPPDAGTTVEEEAMDTF